MRIKSELIVGIEVGIDVGATHRGRAGECRIGGAPEQLHLPHRLVQLGRQLTVLAAQLNHSKIGPQLYCQWPITENVINDARIRICKVRIAHTQIFVKVDTRNRRSLVHSFANNALISMHQIFVTLFGLN